MTKILVLEHPVPYLIANLLATYENSGENGNKEE